jgi:hypothetical protein
MLTMVILPSGGKVLTDVEAHSAREACEEIVRDLQRAPGLTGALGGMVIGVKTERGLWHKFTLAGLGTKETPYLLVPGGTHLRSYLLLTA